MRLSGGLAMNQVLFKHIRLSKERMGIQSWLFVSMGLLSTHSILFLELALMVLCMIHHHLMSHMDF